MNRTTIRGIVAACTALSALGAAAVVTASASADAAARDEPLATYIELDSASSTPAGVARILAAQQADAQTAAAARDAAVAAQAAAARAQAVADAERASRARARAALASRDPRAIARVLVEQRGWSDTQFGCLDDLWSRESGWSVHDRNASSGAYGIPQALPGSKMAIFGRDWRDNPVTQIRWGLYYIANRYGTPCNAWAHSQDRNWY